MKNTFLMLLPDLIGKRSGGSGTVVGQFLPKLPRMTKQAE